ncbi:MAG: transcription-repair coupling factor, partial [Rhodospirillaceae bacterium]
MINIPALATGTRTTLGGVPNGAEALALARLAESGGDVLFVAPDDRVLAQTAAALAFFAPNLACLQFPAWDCLPYDRVSPNSGIVGRRLECLGRLAGDAGKGGRIILATVSGVLQRVPAPTVLAATTVELKAGARIDPGEMIRALDHAGYRRAETVMEPGEFAMRGGIVDVFPPATEAPLRLDFFGDELETMRPFDPASQRSLADAVPPKALLLGPVSEVLLDADAISRFRSGYRAMFGASGADDPLYEAVSAGERMIGMEHWLPLYHADLVTLFDYLPEAMVVLDQDVAGALEARLELIVEYFQARLEVAGKTSDDATVYRPVPPATLFLDEAEWEAALGKRAVAALTPFSAPSDGSASVDLGGTRGR